MGRKGVGDDAYPTSRSLSDPYTLNKVVVWIFL